MSDEQTEILLNAFRAWRKGEITEEQYTDVRRMIADELLEETARNLG